MRLLSLSLSLEASHEVIESESRSKLSLSLEASHEVIESESGSSATWQNN
jgi:hypothetical protein